LRRVRVDPLECLSDVGRKAGAARKSAKQGDALLRHVYGRLSLPEKAFVPVGRFRKRSWDRFNANSLDTKTTALGDSDPEDRRQKIV
jgi:hypothetical protein